ncbi:MAG: TolC family protein [Crocinitomicaceae bacterium]|nr:TolC family protein [Crocinitomicaceae bacterium]
MSDKLKVPILLLVVVLTSRLQAQENVSLSLQQAQEYAVKNSFSVKSSQYDTKSAELQTEELLALGFPQLNGSLQYQNFIDLPTSIVPGDFVGMPGQDLRLKFGMPHQMTAGLSASQLLFNGSWLVGLQASKAFAELKQKQVQKSEIDIKRDVAKAYNLALIATESNHLLRSSQEVLSGLVKETNALYKEGFTEEMDVDQLQLSLNDIEYQIANAEQQMKITKDLLKFTIGMPIATNIELTDKPDELLTASSAELLSANFSSEVGIDFQIAQVGLALQKINLKNERSKFLPALSAFYNLQSQALRHDFNFVDTSKPWFPIQLWGIQLSVPIFSGGQEVKRVQQAKVEVQRMTDMVTLTKEGALLEYNQTKTEYEYALKNYTSTKNSLDLAEKILSKTNIKFKEGVSTSFEVSQNTAQVIQAKGAHIQAMLNLMNARIALTKALNLL